MLFNLFRCFKISFKNIYIFSCSVYINKNISKKIKLYIYIYIYIYIERERERERERDYFYCLLCYNKFFYEFDLS